MTSKENGRRVHVVVLFLSIIRSLPRRQPQPATQAPQFGAFSLYGMPQGGCR